MIDALTWYFGPFAVAIAILALITFPREMLDTGKRILTLEPFLRNHNRCRISEEWGGLFIGRRFCSTHNARWDGGGPCPVRHRDEPLEANPIAELLWDQSVLDTDEFIARVDRELKREQWALIPSGPAMPVSAAVLTENERRDPDVCPWGRYHNPELERCECWDPGQ